MTNSDIARLRELLAGLDVISLTTLDETYRPVSRPMMLRANHFDGSLSLVAPAHSRIVTHIAAMAAVNLADSSSTTSLSLTGMANFTTDPVFVMEHWHDGLRPWLRCGPEESALITVTVDEARFWNVREGDSANWSNPVANESFDGPGVTPGI